MNTSVFSVLFSRISSLFPLRGIWLTLECLNVSFSRSSGETILTEEDEESQRETSTPSLSTVGSPEASEPASLDPTVTRTGTRCSSLSFLLTLFLHPSLPWTLS
jgi:hypothetical protein